MDEESCNSHIYRTRTAPKSPNDRQMLLLNNDLIVGARFSQTGHSLACNSISYITSRGMFMHTETKSNTQEIDSPPVPPAAVFDEQHMAEAQPVRPLPNRQSRKLAGGFQQIFRRRFTTIAPLVAGVIFCVGIGAASVDWDSGPLSSKDDTAQSASELPAPSTAPPTANAAAAKRQDQKRRSFSNPQDRETLPPFESDEAEDNRKPRARLVSVVH